MTLVPIKTAAAQIGCNYWSMRRIHRQEQFPTVMLGGRRMTDIEVLREWAEAHPASGLAKYFQKD